MTADQKAIHEFLEDSSIVMADWQVRLLAEFAKKNANPNVVFGTTAALKGPPRHLFAVPDPD